MALADPYSPTSPAEEGPPSSATRKLEVQGLSNACVVAGISRMIALFQTCLSRSFRLPLKRFSCGCYFKCNSGHLQCHRSVLEGEPANRGTMLLRFVVLWCQSGKLICQVDSITVRKGMYSCSTTGVYRQIKIALRCSYFV